MDAAYQRRLQKLNAILLKKAEDLRNCKTLIAQKAANLRELRNQKVFSCLQLDLAVKKLEELTSDVLMAQKKNEEEFSQRLKLQDQIEKLELQMQHQKHNIFQLISKETNSGGGIEKLQSDHRDSQQHIKDLETRLEKIQDNLLTKLQAVDALQEKNASLQRDITSLKNTFGCDIRTRIASAHAKLSSTPLQFQQTSESKENLSSKPSAKVLYSMFTQSTSTAPMLPGMSTSRMVRFPVSSAVTLDKTVAPSNTGFLLQKQHIPYSSSSNLENDLLGQGQDYVRSLFADSRKTEPVGKVKKLNAPAEYLCSITSSAVGNLKIVEVHSDGHYVKIVNTSPDIEESIGDHALQQNLYGQPIQIFKFPPKIRMKASSAITVWAACSKMPHNPPSDYLWKECEKFKSGPECTTILCTPSGQAIAWYTPINWNQKQTKGEEKSDKPVKNIRRPTLRIPQQRDKPEIRTIYTWQANGTKSPAEKSEPDFIMREEKIPPIRYPVQSAWCQSPSAPTHPHYSEPRCSDGRSFGSPNRAQPMQPGPRPGILYTEGIHGIKSAKGGGNAKNRTRPTRSAGPNSIEGLRHWNVLPQKRHKALRSSTRPSQARLWEGYSLPAGTGGPKEACWSRRRKKTNLLTKWEVPG